MNQLSAFDRATDQDRFAGIPPSLRKTVDRCLKCLVISRIGQNRKIGLPVILNKRFSIIVA
ncbi:hypothetical protein JCM12296A_13100 [Desulfosarcina cetonica]